MNHSDFKLGGEFRSDGKLWRVTDIGARTVIAIRIDKVEAQEIGVVKRRLALTQAEAEAEGWFNGPPYGVAERVFDEDDIEGCMALDEDDTEE